MAGRIQGPDLAGRLLIAAATMFAIGFVRADDVASIAIRRADQTYEVMACASTTATPRLAWQVLTDFDHLSDFIPDMRLSRVISAPGEPLRVEQRGTWHALFFQRRIDVVFAIELDPMRAITFRAVDGNLRPMSGHLRLTGRPDCRIEYRAQSTPAFWIPPLIGPALMRGQIREQLEGVLREIRRRQQVLATSTRHLPAD